MREKERERESGAVVNHSLSAAVFLRFAKDNFDCVTFERGLIFFVTPRVAEGYPSLPTSCKTPNTYFSLSPIVHPLSVRLPTRMYMKVVRVDACISGA